MEKKVNYKRRWNMVMIFAALIIIVTFSPLIIPFNVYKPELLGLPYSLWTGILVSFILVGLTIYGSTVCPGSKNRKD